MVKCKTCGAPVNLAPDGDPRYEAPPQRKPAAPKHLDNMIWVSRIPREDGNCLQFYATTDLYPDYDVYVSVKELARIYRKQDINNTKEQD